MPVQVTAVQQHLAELSIAISGARVAGAFMCDFNEVQQQLLRLQQDVAAVWKDPCHFGVLAALQAADGQQQRMAAAVKVRLAYLIVFFSRGVLLISTHTQGNKELPGTLRSWWLCCQCHPWSQTLCFFNDLLHLTPIHVAKNYVSVFAGLPVVPGAAAAAAQPVQPPCPH